MHQLLSINLCQEGARDLVEGFEEEGQKGLPLELLQHSLGRIHLGAVRVNPFHVHGVSIP